MSDDHGEGSGKAGGGVVVRVHGGGAASTVGGRLAAGGAGGWEVEGAQRGVTPRPVAFRSDTRRETTPIGAHC